MFKVYYKITKEECMEEEIEVNNIYVSVNDGGDVYRDNGISEIIVGKKVFVSFINDTMEFIMEIEVDIKQKNITKNEFLFLYGFYIEFLGEENIERLITILRKEVPKLFQEIEGEKD